MNLRLVSIAVSILVVGGLIAVVPPGAGGSPANAGATFFVPVTPCRVVDTRSGTGGKLLPGSALTWQVTGAGVGFKAQGGKPGGCGIPGSARAVELSVSAVAPAGGVPGWAGARAAGEGSCANAPEPASIGIAAATARAVRTNPNFEITVLIISFSIGVWLGFGVRIKDEMSP